MATEGLRQSAHVVSSGLVASAKAVLLAGKRNLQNSSRAVGSLLSSGLDVVCRTTASDRNHLTVGSGGSSLDASSAEFSLLAFPNRSSRRKVMRFGLVLLAITSFLPASAHAQSGPYGVLSKTSLNFGNVLVGQTSTPERISLTNTGDAQLTVTSISVSGDFAIPTNYCGEGVRPGTHCDIYVTFTPPALGTDTGTVTFTDNASNSPQTVSLTGVGATTTPTSTSITASAKEIYAGAPITFTAIVTTKDGTIPNGEQVLFTSKQGDLHAYGSLQNGVASVTTTLVDTHPLLGVRQLQGILATYPGDQNYDSSTSRPEVEVDVERYDTSIAFSQSPSPAPYCEPITVTVSVSSNGPYTPTGSVHLHGDFKGDVFLEDGMGSATSGVVCVDVGSGHENALYGGDGYNSGTFGGFVPAYTATTTTTSAKSSKNPSKLGEEIHLMATLRMPYRHPVAGSVTFTSGGNTLGTVELSDSYGEITIPSLPAGANTITATFTPGNGNFLGSSASFVQTVN